LRSGRHRCSDRQHLEGGCDDDQRQTNSEHTSSGNPDACRLRGHGVFDHGHIDSFDGLMMTGFDFRDVACRNCASLLKQNRSLPVKDR
jgi:hypothetical protein